MFVESLKSWVDTGGGSTAKLDDLFGLEPRFVLQEDPTLDVLMHFYGMFDAVKVLSKGAPSASSGLFCLSCSSTSGS